jgi:hypothetical protein
MGYRATVDNLDVRHDKLKHPANDKPPANTAKIAHHRIIHLAALHCAGATSPKTTTKVLREPQMKQLG